MKSKVLFVIGVVAFTVNMVNAQVQIGLDIDGEAALDFFGGSVSMPDVHTLAIGASGNDGNGNGAGHVRVFSWNGNSWIQKGADIDGESEYDGSGFAISMPDSNTIAIGAPNNDGGGINSGHVRVYNWNGTSWIQKGIDIDGEAAGDVSGWSVSMPDANTLAIGATKNDDSGDQAGHVRVYTWNGNSWIQKGVDINGEGAYDQSGYLVCMPDVNTLAIGAGGNDGIAADAGHVRVYTWNGSSWIQKGTDIDGEAAFDESGTGITMPNSNTIAIGAPGNDGNGVNSGHVRVYAWNGTTWVLKGLDIDGESAINFSGRSVSMPDDNTLAIGAQFNNGGGIGSGHVRVYDWNGTAWVQTGSDIDGEASDDDSGFSLMMPDAFTVAIGARGNDGGGNSAGHVRVYSVCMATITVQPQNFTAYTGIGWANFKCKSTDTAASFQWQQNYGAGWINLQSSLNILNPTSDSLIVLGVDSSMNNVQYRCLVTTCKVDTSDAAILTVASGIGIDESSLEFLTISPNPTIGSVSLNVSIVGYYELMTLEGHILESGPTTKEFSLTKYPRGVYMLRLCSADGQRVFKIVKY